MKKLLLYFTLLFVPMSILAQTFTQGDLTYTVTSGTNVAVKMKDVTISTAAIPASVTDSGTTYSVTSIGTNAFYGCTGLTSVTIPNSITNISNYAFFNCTGLTSVTIPNSVTNIGSGAFYFCTGLTSVTIPDSVTSIGEAAFINCKSLTSITLGNSIATIRSKTFQYCKFLNTIVIPNSVTSIESRAFEDCTGLTSLTIGNSVTSIENYAFNNCTKLASLTIPNSVANIGSFAFYFCYGLTSVVLGNSVTSIGDSAFASCDAITSVTTLSPTPVAINANVFNGVNITTIPLIVPAGKEPAYENTAVWTDFMSVTGATLGTPSFGKQEKVLVYPNPSTGIFNINNKENVTLEVFDISGKKVKSQKTTGEVSQVDLSGFTDGVYFLKTNKETTKLIKL
ncbi:leucine-rich repeat domain-containing protein [Flavobacterium ajazii]|uniref:leucine-rich repeat domain-containing protein n=1 Tax=Flavobacterium ajazii TaxID=2692318 RepID=UPI0013D13851|nr:leucine-rich repeat domain-containing protein [Flavobacterium ajazii]